MNSARPINIRIEVHIADVPALEAPPQDYEWLQTEDIKEGPQRRCPTCGGTGTHGLIHTRHPEGGGGSNRPCPGGTNA